MNLPATSFAPFNINMSGYGTALKAETLLLSIEMKTAFAL
ncbi:hypothetical protein EM595_1303 [Duffyella gerundensis]|uniref:Uncharacterized protein n=1 Tax=Duffyella gerundensis TaxID=1619313 RepID=A0A0U5GK68_9GAMM|nr:hypothetical protein EM595_1303 [Duffyella gerundensis]